MDSATMQALVYKGNHKIALERRKIPVILHPKDAIVKVTLTTICTSDIHIIHGSVPKAVPGTILGHEFVGEITAIGSEVHCFAPGDRVAVNVETFCGECFYCKRGYVNNCTDPDGGWALGCRIDGGLAEYARIPFADQNFTKIPDSVSEEAALFTGDILATGYRAAGLAELKPEDTLVVIGAGPAGLCAMMSARLYSPSRIIAIDCIPKRLELALSKGLADSVLNPLQGNVKTAVLDITGNRGADAVIEMAGGENTFTMAWELARPNAVVVLSALYEKPQLLPLPDMYGKNLTFKMGGVDACCCKEIMDLIEEGRLDTSCLITHRTNIGNIMEAYDVFAHKKDNIMKWAITT